MLLLSVTLFSFAEHAGFELAFAWLLFAISYMPLHKIVFHREKEQHPFSNISTCDDSIISCLFMQLSQAS